jgi:HlyD family secretion protein
MKRFILVLVVGAACIAAGVGLEHFGHVLPYLSNERAGPNPASAIDGGTRKVVAALGRLEPEGEILDISAGTAGDRVDRLLVSEGQHVQAEQILVYLESYQSRRAEVEYTSSQLAEARARLVAETAYGEALVKEAKLAVETVEKLRPLEIEAQEAKVRLYQAERDYAQKDARRVADLKASDASTQQELEHQLLAERRTREELISAEALLRQLKAAQAIDLAKSRAALATAQAALARARDAQPVASLAKSLVLAEERLKLSVLKAPGPGEILQIRTHPGEAVGTRPILRMGRTDAMFAVAEVYYTDIRFVHVGQNATITSLALPESLQGTVVRVGSLIAKNDVLNLDPTASVDARVVEVRIRLEPNALASRLSNLQVDVRISVDGEAP